MGRSVFYLVSDNEQMVHRARSFAQVQGVELECYTPTEWSERLSDPQFRDQLLSMSQDSTELAKGTASEGAKILRFPKGGASAQSSSRAYGSQVKTIDEMEKMAIESAIEQFNGNLTEAAKALGIGRATLYRKVKLYQLDPNQARRNRAA